MPNTMTWVPAAFLLCVSGCDDRILDQDVARAEGAWTAVSYDDPVYDPKSDTYTVWEIDFESAKDVMAFASETGCDDKTDAEIEECSAVEPALELYDTVDPGNGSSEMTVCQTVGGRRPDGGRGSCTTCCTIRPEGVHCTTRCIWVPPVVR